MVLKVLLAKTYLLHYQLNLNFQYYFKSKTIYKLITEIFKLEYCFSKAQHLHQSSKQLMDMTILTDFVFIKVK